MSTRITYVYYSKIFAERDRQLLYNSYDIDMLYYAPNTYHNFSALFQYVKSSFRSVNDSSVVIFLMGGAHIWIPMLWARLLGKKTMIILGGADSHNLPFINYGIFNQKGLKRRLNSLMYHWTNILAPVDESLIQSTNNYLKIEGHKGGIKTFLPDIKTPFVTIPTEYDPDFWRYYSDNRQGVIAATPLDDEKTFLLKGFDMILDIARKMPKVNFSIVGVDKDYQNTLSNIPSNVKIYGFKSSQELVELYNHHQVYLLPSLSEGLPNVLCESMMCGCIPVASNVGGNKKAIGDAGYIIKNKNVDTYIKAISQALLDSIDDRHDARNRIINLFGKGTRKKLLGETINDLIS